MAANFYIVADESKNDAFLIDPGGDPGRIKQILKKKDLNLKFIINTHGHGDHIFANGSFDVPIYIHKLEKEFLTDPDKNLSGMFGFLLKTPKAAKLLEDGEKIYLNDMEIEILHTPGHTPGSVSVKLNGAVFTGDALFRGGVGRTDFPYGDWETLLKSIRERLLVLDDETVIYPGHGDASTIGEERRSNPFL